MFLLYKALKHQSEKGLVDAVTSDAGYTLSEDKLLPRRIEPKILVGTLYILLISLEYLVCSHFELLESCLSKTE